jgi:hypothetical protein
MDKGEIDMRIIAEGTADHIRIVVDGKTFLLHFNGLAEFRALRDDLSCIADAIEEAGDALQKELMKKW